MSGARDDSDDLATEVLSSEITGMANLSTAADENN